METTMAKINGMPWNDGDWGFGHSLAVNPEIVGEWWEVDLNGLEGTNGADEIYGYGGNDVLQGRGGNDILDGGEGTDLMNGGAGDDTYYVDNVGDIVEDVDVGLDVPGGVAPRLKPQRALVQNENDADSLNRHTNRRTPSRALTTRGLCPAGKIHRLGRFSDLVRGPGTDAERLSERGVVGNAP
jgi:hypothetical protein